MCMPPMPGPSPPHLLCMSGSSRAHQKSYWPIHKASCACSFCAQKLLFNSNFDNIELFGVDLIIVMTDYSGATNRSGTFPAHCTSLSWLHQACLSQGSQVLRCSPFQNSAHFPFVFKIHKKGNLSLNLVLRYTFKMLQLFLADVLG